MENEPPKIDLKRIIDSISGLPTLPVVITKVTKLMQNPKVSAAEIAQAISSDQALASKILKIVNSSFYGFPSRIKTITHAIVILGFNSIKATAMSASIFSSFSGEDKDSIFDMEGFWSHSIGVGAASKILAKRLKMKEVEEAFLAGLMHDLGKVILDQYMHKPFTRILDIVKTKKCLISEAEKIVLGGHTHADIGALLVQKWNLNPEFVAIIKDHNSPTSASDYFKLTSVVHVADAFIRAMDIGNPGDDLIPKINPGAWNELNINPVSLPQIFKEISEEVKKTEIFFKMTAS